MQTAAIGFGQMQAPEAPDTPAASGFAEALSVARSGAPPGPEPPPDKAPEAGAVTLQPNAGAQTLDLLPENFNNEEVSVDAGVVSVDLLALVAAQVTPIPVPLCVEVTGAKPVPEGALELQVNSMPQMGRRELPIVPPAVNPHFNEDAGGMPKPMSKPPIQLETAAMPPILPKEAEGVDATLSISLTKANPKVAKEVPATDNVAVAEVEAALLSQTDQKPTLINGTKAMPVDIQPQVSAVDAVTPRLGAEGERPKPETGELTTELSLGGPEVSIEVPEELLNLKGETVSRSTETADTAEVGTAKLSQETVSRVIRRAADRIELLALTKATESVTVRLDPVDLGSITMIVKSATAGVDAQISATNDQVRQALEQNRFQLGQALESRGLSLSSLELSSQSSSTQTTADQQMRQAFQQRTQQGRPQPALTSNLNMPSLEVQRSFARSSIGVDVWI